MTPQTCSVDGCDRPMSSRGMCAAHYERARRGSGVPLDRPIGQQGACRCCGTVPCSCPLTCTCPTPHPDGIGECRHCHRLVLTQERVDELIAAGRVPEGTRA